MTITGRSARPRAIATLLPSLTAAAARRYGVATATLITRWPQIVGVELAALTQPETLALPPGRGEGVLTLRVPSAAATTLQHQTPVLLERVNAFFGYAAVTRLRLRQGALPRVPPPTRGAAPPPPTALVRSLTAQVAPVGDPALRAALIRFGTAVSQRAAAQRTAQTAPGRPKSTPGPASVAFR